ncbi:uncharacterized protein [Triticum aestivum]|uniref:uncharacterized protein n=1 Tax=Triticum aestivum TaxID=4565 RepID=UPI001D020F8E|nr:uncharacterized protein LOC123115146 [Triticum aestivum]
MARKRKADDNLTGTRHPAARRDPTAGDDLAGTSANNTGPTANAAGDGIAEISPAMEWLLEVTSGYARGSPEFDGGGCPRNQSIRASSCIDAGSWIVLTSHTFVSCSCPRGRGWVGVQGIVPVAWEGAADALPGDAPAAAGQSSRWASARHQPVPRADRPWFALRPDPEPHRRPQADRNRAAARPLRLRRAFFDDLLRKRARCSSSRLLVSPLARDGYNNFVTSNVLPQHPEIRYVPPAPRPVPSYGGATQGQDTAIGHQRQLDPRLRQPSSAAPAGVAVGPRTWGPSAQWCRLCPAPATRVYCSAPFCEVCYSRLFAADDVPQQHAQTGGYAPRGAVPASEQQSRAAAIRPSSSSSSSSSVGSGPICQACGHLISTRNRMCRSCHRQGSARR